MKFIIGLLCTFSIVSFSWARDISVGFLIYGDPLPKKALYVFDWLIVNPDSLHIDGLRYRAIKPKLIAYVSIGEVEPYREYFKDLKKEWILGDNITWKSKIVDIRRDDYVEFLLKKVFSKLDQFDGFFLDTLDSYQNFLESPENRKPAEDNLVRLIKTLRSKYPDKIILINRGFEIVERVSSEVNGLVAESLFYGLKLGEEIDYRKMNREETEWLLGKLNHAKNLGLKVIVVDYVPPNNRKLQLETARKIYKLGFIPYVSDRYLRTLGVSTYNLSR